MVLVELHVTKKKRGIPAIYFFEPSRQFYLFEEKVKEALSLLDERKITNRALFELMERRGWKKMKILRNKFKRLDGASLKKRKAIYNAFYRIFQRFNWAMESGSEREIELKVWITSSLDYLCEFTGVLERRDD